VQSGRTDGPMLNAVNDDRIIVITGPMALPVDCK